MLKIVFLHPDLGIGGAERLVVDAALALQLKGHQVHIVTSYHDPAHCFPETRDGTIPVTISGNWLPRSIFGRFLALCAYIRMLWASFYTVFLSDMQPQVYFCDQVSMCIPVLRLSTSIPVIYYCHFPDLLLASHKTWIKKLYRAPLDWIEEKTTGLATATVVNSHFTAGVFCDTFKSIRRRPKVLYPSLNFRSFDRECGNSLSSVIGTKQVMDFVFLSINRYERKKNLGLAIKAFGLLKSFLGDAKIHLIMVGGYDYRLVENVEHYDELQKLTSSLQLGDCVTFLRSPSDETKTCLLKNCHTLLYTPDKEHFGIVPLEAMYCQLPVIAVNSGGPLETVEDHRTGYLCHPTVEDFAEKMKYLYDNRNLATKMGERGRQRVIEHFSFNSFSQQLNELVGELTASST
ncbi:alpha-1,3/1,6-mannosyltransferase ALG2 isoform X1 [Daphnia magna]|uniref:Alpha-1,3/1,6-mannosyltransferase ALG2 n=1 Tax=Daphnia magna TaxID=35525 RepID=A0A0N7ZGS9_9CRUS|nr:alpha-1,3/1,6-mannosyltransferase ALG2 isoform X1 [Daphnia magna]KZS10906.1 Alpha-1,3/1,6-mannosyltransferase ALG2 [Daphnia magna]SVE81317.1 EOG090X069M [Daphnia magna]SVE83072.1 EOG090X069M [Daphnia magna]